MNKFWVIALTTYKKHVKSTSFIMMVLAPLLLIGLSLGSSYLGSKFSEDGKIAIISTDNEIRKEVINSLPENVKVVSEIDTVEKATEGLVSEEIDGYLDVTLEGYILNGKYIGTSSASLEQLQSLQSSLSVVQLSLSTKKLGLTNEEVALILAPAQLSETQMKVKDNKLVDNDSDSLALTLVSFFIVLAMYMIVLLYSSITAQEVASEKGTRIMEIILSSTTAMKYFYAKIMGIFLVILTQVAIYLGVGVIAYVFAKDLDSVKSILDTISLSELVKGILGYNLIYLVFGVLIYTILSAFTGSLVSKSEDSAKAVAPVTYLIMLASLPTLMLGLSDPNNIMIKVFSYIPFFSSFAMPLRIATDSATNLEVIISVVLLIVSTGLLLRVSAKVYKSTVLIYSDKSMLHVLKSALT